MSVTTDPTQIQLDRGEVEEIITDREAQTGIPYLVQITSNNGVRYAHEKRNAERGIELSGQQTHTLSNFRGSGVYVSAVNGPATLRVRPAGADLTTEPEQKVRITGGDLSLSSTVDVSSRSNRDLGAVDVTDINDTVTVNVNDSFGTESTLQSVLSTLNTLEGIQDNATGVSSFSAPIGTTSQALPTTNVPAGKQLSIKADSDNTADILVGDFPLSPGDGISLSISNADQIQVVSQSGTQTIFGIVES